MRRRAIFVAAVTTAVLLPAAGCHRRPAVLTPAPSPAAEDYCYWTAFRTTLPADTVAARYLRAFTSVGLAPMHASRLADTTWADAGPTVLTRPEGRAAYAARVVAFQRGDTTLYRAFVAIAPPPGGWATPDEGERDHLIAFCAALNQAAQAGGTTRGEPGAEEALGVWRRR